MKRHNKGNMKYLDISENQISVNFFHSIGIFFNMEVNFFLLERTVSLGTYKAIGAFIRNNEIK